MVNWPYTKSIRFHSMPSLYFVNQCLSNMNLLLIYTIYMGGCSVLEYNITVFRLIGKTSTTSHTQSSGLWLCNSAQTERAALAPLRCLMSPQSPEIVKGYGPWWKNMKWNSHWNVDSCDRNTSLYNAFQSSLCSKIIIKAKNRENRKWLIIVSS